MEKVFIFTTTRWIEEAKKKGFGDCVIRKEKC
jgi:hypothetical protein